MIRLPPREKSFTDDFSQLYLGKKCRTITFIVTHACPLRCSYCYQSNKAERRMTFDIAKRCVDLLFDEDIKNSRYINEDKMNGLILDFIGGEPLLEIELIDQIMDYFIFKALDLNHRWAVRHMISISSNGVLYFDPKVTSFLRKHQGRVHIGITIDGNQKLHDTCRKFPDGRPSYHLAAAAFKDAQRRFGQDGTKLTIAQANLPYFFEACRDMISEFDLKYLQGNVVFEDEWTNQDANLYYYQLKQLADWLIETERWATTWVAFFDSFIGHEISEHETQTYCGGAGDMLAFDIDGTCYPCLRYSPVSMPKEFSKQFIIGHCDTGLESTPCQQSCVSCLYSITRRTQSTDECWNCPIGSGCANCLAWDAEHNGSPNIRCTHICPMHHARVLATSYFYNTLYRKFNEPDRFQLNVPHDKGTQIIDEGEYQMLILLSQQSSGDGI